MNWDVDPSGRRVVACAFEVFDAFVVAFANRVVCNVVLGWLFARSAARRGPDGNVSREVKHQVTGDFPNPRQKLGIWW